ncbi:hypothetical protein CVT26_001551 [Gymnopilus dilepis]|uniref:Uncharacterized protein n=1 Tax=Gymnopilus dilepis TaxID=231916 RepID=A0A409WAW0_9AGAR|nr:hypothetical protein CVT26_001551 [Gymnopilus dilepis]
MKFSFSAAFLSMVALASASVLPRESCPDASRFGVLSYSSPTGATSYSAGDAIHVHVDFDCAINYYGIKPQFFDYLIEVPANANNGYEAPIVLGARRTLADGATTDDFDTTIPHGYYFANAAYNIFLVDTYPTQGTDGSEILLQGSVEVPITINATS